MVVTDILKNELGYKGIVVSDDLEMDAIIDRFSTLKAVQLGIKAGVDLFLVCKSQHLWLPLCKQLVEAVKDNADMQEKILSSAQKILALKARHFGTQLP